MNAKKLSVPAICHLILMAVLCVLSITSAVIVFSGNTPSGFEVNQTTVMFYAVTHVINAVALGCGILYMLKGSGKNVAPLYKTFILLVTLGVVLRLIGTLIDPGFGLRPALMIAVILALIVLTFVKNLGKQTTWIVFYILLALEIVLAIVTFDKAEVLSSIAGNLTRLVLAGSIGIAIHAKYADKAARGRD